MIVFKPVTLEARELITSYTVEAVCQNCDLAFSNLCSWSFLYHTSYAVVNDFLFIRFLVSKDKLAYLVPQGKGDFKAAIELIAADSHANEQSLYIYGISPRAKERIESLFSDEFKFFSDRSSYDYIYRVKDLVELTGKKYQPKRNHINKFKKLYPAYRLIPITSDVIPSCIELAQKWSQSQLEKEGRKDVQEEKSVEFGLTNFDALGLTGLTLWVEDQLVAFSYGSPITQTTFGVHVEKANTDFEGAYAFINQSFASMIPAQYEFVNREEDLGEEGLRKAKLSYQPILLLEKNTAIKEYQK